MWGWMWPKNKQKDTISIWLLLKLSDIPVIFDNFVSFRMHLLTKTLFQIYEGQETREIWESFLYVKVDTMWHYWKLGGASSILEQGTLSVDWKLGRALVLLTKKLISWWIGMNRPRNHLFNELKENKWWGIDLEKDTAQFDSAGA